MSKQNNKMTAFFPALGLIFGAGAGVFMATLKSWNIAPILIVGAVLGLTAGLIVCGLTKQSGK